MSTASPDHTWAASAGARREKHDHFARDYHIDTAAQRWDRAASEVPYDEATLRQSYVRTGARATFSRGLHHNLGFVRRSVRARLTG